MKPKTLLASKILKARSAGFTFFARVAGVMALLVLAACNNAPTPTATPAPPTPNIILNTPTLPGVTAPAPTSVPSATPASQLILGVVGTEETWLNTVRPIATNLGAQLLENADASALVAQGAQALLLDEAASAQAVEVARANPNVFVISLGIVHGEIPANLLALGGPETREDQAGFLAGLLAGFATELQRVAVVSDPGLRAGKNYRNGFTAGVRYACPKCQIDLIDLSSALEAGTVSAEVLKFVALGVDVFWVAPSGPATAALEALAAKNVSVIAGHWPPASETLLASVTLDYGVGLTAALQSWQAGQTPSGQQPLSLANGAITFAIQHDPRGLLSPLDITDIEATKEKLATGVLETGVDPATGEEK